MEEDKNIFETAAKKLGRKGKTPVKKKVSPKEIPTSQPGVYRDPEVNEMMRQIREMNEDLQSQMESVSKKSGLSYDELQRLVQKNAAPGDLELLKKNMDELGEKIKGAVGTPPPKPKQRENLAGERKAKTLGARKKWIPMR
ncbi:MAG: hypothetical protein LLG04_00305 [Parachlamydia sp.]|nr:hypothetical protein [Parachlamydia sp.]